MKPISSTPPDGSSHARASDDDRERVAAVLGAAYARGVLDADEHEQRIARTWEARHIAELATLTRDLPGPDRDEVARVQRDTDLREWLEEWRWWLGSALVMSAIWGVQVVRSGPDFYWPLIPLGIWAAILVAVAIWPAQDKN